jgi:transcription termination/antitermination protein NusG
MEKSPLSDYCWYTLQILSNQELRAKEYLEKLIKNESFADCVKQVLVPTEKVVEVKNGKKRARLRKFYPGYMFIHMRLYDNDGKLLQDVWNFIKHIQGIVDFVGGQSPAVLKKSEIERIMGQMKDSEGKEVPTVSYEVGHLVKINEGPFINLTGQIEEVDPQKGKLKVLLSIFGRSTPVEVEYWQVNKEEN